MEGATPKPEEGQGHNKRTEHVAAYCSTGTVVWKSTSSTGHPARLKLIKYVLFNQGQGSNSRVGKERVLAGAPIGTAAFVAVLG